MEDIIKILKEIIDQEGPRYISREPYRVYERLIAKKVEASLARMVLVTILSGAPAKAKKLDKELLSKEIQQDCYMKKNMADKLTEMYKALYDKKNQSAWNKKKLSGFNDFYDRTWQLEWSGRMEWHSGGGYVERTCKVYAEMCVSDSAKLKTFLGPVLKKNPFISSDRIYSEIKKILAGTLESSMAEFVNEDDYYEPYMEDYDCGYALEKLCAETGLEVNGYSCDGETSDWMLEGRR